MTATSSRPTDHPVVGAAVSVVLVTYDSGGSLDACIASLLHESGMAR